MSKPRQPEAVITTPRPYNPLDTENLGRSVAEALLGRKPTGLQDLPSFEGAGLYALYYQGGHPVYDRLAALNRSADPQAPIYVGKAVPEGARKGGVGTRKASNTALFKRLTEHAESIRVTRDLNLADFSCRFLVVEDIWIPLGESLLIAKFSPVWNQIVEGFGNHDPGSGRHNGKRPRWDVLHPGRSWAEKCQPRPETAEQIGSEVSAHLRAFLPISKPHYFVEQPQASYRVEPKA
ncbi:Eco29kI family restriction endonuclease [Roseateles sp.]|uniref:Eco29kI family restriction endonuclease n=1 Tax=Roseateles sp. TaxID=1971397 RepID=UPI00393C6720